MCYQKQLLIDSSIAALDKIDEKCPFPDFAQRTQLLDVLMEKITIYKEYIRRDIDKSCSIWHNFPLFKTETCATLEKLDIWTTRSIWAHRRPQAHRSVNSSCGPRSPNVSSIPEVTTQLYHVSFVSLTNVSCIRIHLRLSWLITYPVSRKQGRAPPVSPSPSTLIVSSAIT